MTHARAVAVAAFACLLSSAFGQDAGPPRFAFSVEQGWTLTADSEGDFPDIQENDLQQDLNPRFRPPLTRPSFPARDRDNRPRPRNRTIPLSRKDPLKLEGSVAILPRGACRPAFKRIEYWDRTQRYWIEFTDDKVRTHELGGVEKWSGTRTEWAARLEKLETSFLEAHFKVMTPQKPAPAERLGLEGSAAPEPAWRLFVGMSLEEQLAILALARLDGATLDRVSWPAGFARYPDRSLMLARALLDRMLAQADGTFAPEPARARPGRALKNEAWLGTEVAIPSFQWPDGRPWAAERLKPVEEARARLRALADASNVRRIGPPPYLDPDAWRAAVEEEAKALRKLYRAAPTDRAASPDDALLPRTRAVGTGTYDLREKTELKEGVLISSEADVRGHGHDIEIFYFHSGQNLWKTSVVQLETWYKAKVRRE
ncbi:MAG: hypothetical protein HY293_17920 [Planctomycetes bacterium]|nr:hypothetical protein [Planctomycetota bacterium]